MSLLELKFAIIRKAFHIRYRLGGNDLPPSEVDWALKSWKGGTWRIRLAMDLYARSGSYDLAAKYFNPSPITRERIRQMVAKGVRQAWHAHKISRK